MCKRYQRLSKDFRGESGYSMVEVLVAILILSVAIIPMVGMFDTGLRTATLGSNYDTARSLAKKQVETVQSLSYNTIRTSMPNAPCTFDATGLCLSANRKDLSGAFDSFRYTIKKQYVVQSGSGFTNDDQSTGMMRVTVTVGWGGSSFNEKTYTTTVLKAK